MTRARPAFPWLPLTGQRNKLPIHVVCKLRRNYIEKLVKLSKLGQYEGVA